MGESVRRRRGDGRGCFPPEAVARGDFEMRSSLCQTSELVLKTEELEKTRCEKAKFEKATAASKSFRTRRLPLSTTQSRV